MAVDLRCRVCGLPQLDPPWGKDGKSPSFEICACCGVEFGYEDALPAAAKQYRSTWLTNGAAWHEPKARPAGWDLKKQIESVPTDFQ